MSVYIAPYTFNFSNSLIVVDSGSTDVDCIGLYNAIKLAQASEEGIIYDRIGKGSGLDSLGPGVQVGITVELLGSWQLYFPSGNYIARVAGGNLIGGPSDDPIAYTAGVQTLLIQSAASTVVTSDGSTPVSPESLAAAVANVEIETGYDLKEVLRLMSAALAGKLSGATGSTVTIRDINDAIDRIVASVDGDGNRTSITYNVGD